MTLLWLIAAFVAMCAAAVNSGFEVGIYSFSRIRLRYRLSGADVRAKALAALVGRPERLISGILIAQNITVYFVTAVVTSLLEDAGVRWAQGWSTLVLAVVFFVFVEAVPKNTFRRAGDVLVYPLARPYRYILLVLKPAVLFLTGVTRLVLHIGGGSEADFDPFFTRERLAFYMREGHSEGVLSKYQVDLAQNILRGEHVTVARAMVKMDDVAAVPATISWEDFRQIARSRGFSRYPVYGDKREEITGILNIYDCYVVERGERRLEEVIRPVVYFRPDAHVTEALKILRDARQPMGIVTDNGSALGIVTIKDCVEEIVGELYEW
ncbi:MAG: DUF21 domain-containing protein [Planctomycetes bacterium]|nr:DUF21 domain-containing protein [Planctomycetota bacterium]